MLIFSNTDAQELKNFPINEYYFDFPVHFARGLRI